MPNYDPILMTFNNRPRAILDGMRAIVRERGQVKNTYQRRRKLPWLLALAGLPFVLVDLAIRLLGYPVCIFSFLAPIFWVAALVAGLSLRRARTFELPPRFRTAQEILYTLRDDVNPGRNFFGQLDLTGAMLPAKLVQETPNALGLKVQHFRDEWLSLKTKLYDGNMLRLSAAERNKIRAGYWKRSKISGKNKWKPPKEKGNLQELKLRISVNPEIYEIVNTGLQVNGRVGAYTITNLDTSGGILSLQASCLAKDVEANDVLGVLRSAYDQLKRKV
jgi:hypothetical protein